MHYLLVTPKQLLYAKYHYSPVGPERLVDQTLFPLEQPEDFARALARLRGRHKPSTDDSWHLGLPLRHFSFVEFSLPPAALEDLDQAVRYGLMRHVPYDVADAYLRYDARLEEDAAHINATLCLRAPLESYLDAMQQAGIAVSTVFPSLALVAQLGNQTGTYVSGGAHQTEVLAWRDQKLLVNLWDQSQNPAQGRVFLSRVRPVLDNAPLPANTPVFAWENNLETDGLTQALGLPAERVQQLEGLPSGAGQLSEDRPYAINLVPKSVLRKRRISTAVMAASLVVLLVSLLALPFAYLAGKQAQLDALDARIDALQPQATRLAKLRSENKKILAEVRAISERVAAGPVEADMLRELTLLLPDDTYVFDLRLKEGQLQMRGQAEDATKILEVLEGSPYFQQARFDAPLTKRGAKEIFKAAARLDTPPPATDAP